MAKRKKPDNKRNALRQRLKSLEGEILDLKNQSSDTDTNSIDSLEKLSKIEEKRTENLKEYYNIRKEIRDLEKEAIDDSKTKEKERSSETRHARIITDAEENLLELRERSSVLMHSFNDDAAKSAQILGITANQTKQLAGQLGLLKDITGINAVQNDAIEKTLRHTVKNAASLDNLSTKIVENMENMKKNGYELIDTYAIERQLKEQIARLDLNTNNMSYEAWEIQREMADNQLQELERLKKINKKLAEKGKLISEAKENSQKTKLAFLGMMTAIPGGRFLFDKLGLGKVITGTQTVGQTIRGWGASLKGFAIAAPFAALLGVLNLIVAAFKFIMGAAFELDSRIANVSRTLTVSRGEATKLEGRFAQMALSMNLVGVNTEEFLKTVEHLSEEYGVAASKIMSATTSSRWVEGMTVLREKFQLTNEEANNLGKISSILGTSLDGLVYISTKLTKSFMNNRQMLKAMSNIPQIMATGMKNSVIELAKFAAKAKLMGIDLKGFGDALSNMFDIESSLEKQMTATVITGYHFENADAMRLALNSMQYGTAFDMLMQNIGDIRSLAEMPGGLIGVKSMADFFGFSVDQFTEYFNRFKELKKVFGGANPMEQAEKYMQMSAKELRALLKSGQLSGDKAKKGFIENLAAEKEGADLQAEFTDKINKLKLSLMSSTLPIIDELRDLFKSIVENPDFKKFMFDTIKRLPDLIRGLIDLGRQVKNLIGVVFDFLKGIGIVTETVETGVDGTQKKVLGLNSALFDMSNILTVIGGWIIGKRLFSFLGGKILEGGWNAMTGGGKTPQQMAQNITGNTNLTQTLTPQQMGVTPKKTGEYKQQITKNGVTYNYDAGTGMYSPQSQITSNINKKNPPPSTKPKSGGLKAGLGGLILSAAGGVAGSALKNAGNEKAGAWVDILSQAGGGALMGSAAGPWGALAGGLIGGGLALYNNWDSLSGKKQNQMVQQQQYQSEAQPYTAPQQAQAVTKQNVTVNVNTVALEQKMEKLISIINNMATQPTYIKIGERTVEAIAGEINWKKQMKIGTDNTYASSVRDTD